MLNKTGDGGHPRLTLNFKWKAFKILPLSMMFALITDYVSQVFHRLYLYYHSGRNIFLISVVIPSLIHKLFESALLNFQAVEDIRDIILD